MYSTNTNARLAEREFAMAMKSASDQLCAASACRGRIVRILSVSSQVLLGGLTALAGCGNHEAPEPVASRISALSVASIASADTFINNASPDNNNGRNGSIYTGRNDQGGIMRGLIRFDLPQTLQARATVSNVTLTMTTRGLGSNGTAPPAPATASLQAVTTSWTEGNGIGNDAPTFTVGDPCGTTGATWNQPNCTGGASWAGGAVATTVSGQASVPAAISTAVVWDSATAGNAGMVADVQGWLDDPTANQGWRIVSSTEAVTSAAQRFYSAEGSDLPVTPRLAVTYACKGGFAEQGSGCTTCTATARTACAATVQGNACADSGPPATTYKCTCGNAYTGTGTTACTDRNDCSPNHCEDNGDTAATCTDAVAPASGYTCTCSTGYVFNGTSCVSACPGPQIRAATAAPVRRPAAAGAAPARPATCRPAAPTLPAPTSTPATRPRARAARPARPATLV